MKFSNSVLILSWALLLFFLGLLLLLIVHGSTIKHQLIAKNNVIIEISDNKEKPDLNALTSAIMSKIDLEPDAIDYITKEESFRQLKNQEDYSGILDSINPFLDMVLITIPSSLYTNTSLRDIEKLAKEWDPSVKLIYESNFNQKVDGGFSLIRFALIIITVLFGLMTVTLIYQLLTSKIRQDKKLIEIQLLVGATSQYVLRPWLWKSFKMGLISFLLTALVLSIMYVSWFSSYGLTDLFSLLDFILILFVLLIISEGVALISTYIIVNLYLRRFSIH